MVGELAPRFETSDLAQIAPATRGRCCLPCTGRNGGVKIYPNLALGHACSRDIACLHKWGRDELNIYDAEDDEDMDAIMKALDEATAE